MKLKKTSRQRTSSTDDDDEEDDVPLLKIKCNGFNGETSNDDYNSPLRKRSSHEMNSDDRNAYRSLCKNNVQFCEFCNNVSNNRYSSLIHNISHIIIPLIKQTVYQCEICLHHFTSEKELKLHHRNKHHISEVDQRNDSNQFICNIKELKREESEDVIVIDDDSTDELTAPSIKNRLMFEEDIDLSSCDQLLNDLTTDCKVNIEVTLPSELFDDEFRNKSVHYDELVKPGVYRCRKCHLRFPVRLEAIIHEASHIRLRDTQVTQCCICSQYIKGNTNNLRLHYLSQHKQNKEPIQPQTLENTLEKIVSENRVEIKKLDLDELEKNDVSVTAKNLMLCELCFSFCRNKPNVMVYKCFGHISQLGKRFVCDKCGGKFFEVKMVRREYAYRRTGEKRKRKNKSNEDRLELIRKRLKRMKYM